MFDSIMLDRYADILHWGLTTARTRPYEPGDVVLLRYDPEAVPLAEAVYDRLLDEGLLPVSRFNGTSRMELSFYAKTSEDILTARMPGDKELYENLSGVISLIAPSSITHLRDVPPERFGKLAVSRKYLREIMERREAEGLLGWTLCALPTGAQAEAAGISVDEYGDQIVRACFLDKPDPVAEWRRVYEQAQEVKTWLNAMSITSLRVATDNMDLVVTPGDERRWIGISGHNIPSFEIFLSPDWRGTSGTYYADQPSYRSGNLVKGVRLAFENGVVTEATAEEGEAFLKKQVAMDPGASRVGEFSLTDRRFSRIDTFMANTLYDENFGGEHGNCHIAVGASYADTFAGDQNELTKELKETLGFNDSALHWDLVNTENKVVTASLASGREKIIYENGQFTC